MGKAETIKRKGQEIEVWLDGELKTNVECELYREMDIKIIIKPKCINFI